MCGIFGFSSSQDVSENLKHARNSLHTLKHRGPDQWGDWYNESTYIGHHRLSILDLSDNARQPMHEKNEQIIIAVNGEIYNYIALKNELQKKHKFFSTSDSEVILHGYKEWGIEILLSKLEGMFAFSILDVKKNVIILARDRVGIKPLYYAYVNNQYIWSSELKAIEFFSLNKLEQDKTALYDFLTYLYIPCPKTLYKNVNKLEPAHFITFNINTKKINKKRYWELNSINSIRKTREAENCLESLLCQSIKEQLMSDVPVGFFLSGGIDSSTVVALASKISNNINTYSIGFDVKTHNELDYAKIIANQFNTNHTEKVIQIDLAQKLYSYIKTWFDEPFADTSALPTHLVSSIARNSSTVVLTGDGGDEVFGGYKWYDPYIFKGFKQKLHTIKEYFNKQKDTNFNTQIIEYHVKALGGLLIEEKHEYKKIFNIENDYNDYWYFYKYYNTDLPLLTRLQYLDFHTYLHDDILTKVDRASMAVSLEARVPLLSTEIIEYVFSIDEKIRYKNYLLKGLLKDTIKKYLPEEILNRGKKGFSIPQTAWHSTLFKQHDTKQEAILNRFFLK